MLGSFWSSPMLGTVSTLLHRFWSDLLILLFGLGFPLAGFAQEDTLTWTFLTPENDTRAADVRNFDMLFSKRVLARMNSTEEVFHHHLSWQTVPILHPLDASAPFCELDFDPVNPLILTPQEKTILQEYLTRGGFIFLCEDAYPYSRDEFWSVKKWPIIDFLTKELPVSDRDFTFERITQQHGFLHEYYTPKIDEILAFELIELKGNPTLPDLTLVSYRGHPCAFVLGNYAFDENGWVTRPFPSNIMLAHEVLAFYVNIYVYVMMH